MWFLFMLSRYLMSYFNTAHKNIIVENTNAKSDQISSVTLHRRTDGNFMCISEPATLSQYSIYFVCLFAHNLKCKRLQMKALKCNVIFWILHTSERDTSE